MQLVTILFTDVVESSTIRRDVSFGRDAKERDSTYHEKVQIPQGKLIRECCSKYDGRIVNTMGDSFFLVFEDPFQAVRCAVSIQQNLTTTPIETPRGDLRLRIGLHSGYPISVDNDLQGTDVDTASRVQGAATPGQILLSDRTHALVSGMSDVKFHQCGEVELKGVGPIALWKVNLRRPLDIGQIRRWAATISIVVATAIGIAGVAIYSHRTSEHIHPTEPPQLRSTPAAPESPKGAQVFQAAPSTGLVDWHDKHNWRKSLRIGMSKAQVQQLFGEPERVHMSEELETWDYGSGEITFWDGQLHSWFEPD
jgi:class 3 adenylate cyclase